jgi:hypothetical protein
VVSDFLARYEVKTMELNVGLIEGLAVFGVVWWLVYKAFSPQR